MALLSLFAESLHRFLPITPPRSADVHYPVESFAVIPVWQLQVIQWLVVTAAGQALPELATSVNPPFPGTVLVDGETLSCQESPLLPLSAKLLPGRLAAVASRYLPAPAPPAIDGPPRFVPKQGNYLSPVDKRNWPALLYQLVVITVPD